MKPGGDSESWEAQKGNQKNIGTQFLKEGLTDAALKAEAGEEWGKMPEAVACKPEIYEHLATYLCEGYRIAANRKNGGNLLDLKTAHGTWSGLINQNHTRFSATAMNASAESLVSPARPARHASHRPPSRPVLCAEPVVSARRRSSTASRATPPRRPSGTRASRPR